MMTLSQGPAMTEHLSHARPQDAEHKGKIEYLMLSVQPVKDLVGQSFNILGYLTFESKILLMLP